MEAPEKERHNEFRRLLLGIAKFYLVSNAERLSLPELYNALSNTSTPIWKYINEYFKAYNKWLSYYKATPKPEPKKLGNLIIDRDKKKKALLSAFDELKHIY